MMTALRFAASCLAVLAASGSMAQQDVTRSQFSELRIDGATIQIACSGNTAELDMAELRNWIADSAQAIQTYYGQFPVRQLRIQVNAVEGRGAQSGTTYTYSGALIRVGVGRFSSNADLKRDWIMTHEMVHLTMPELDDRYAWLQEGLATYVEPVARAQAGQLSEEKVWQDMVRDMPKGLPEAGDRGLDHTHTWGRTYWGGALFFLLADVQIREKSGNRFGLQHALRAMLAGGGSEDPNWDVRRKLAIGDKATGTDVLIRLYDQMRDAPVSPDLAALWQRLGVRLSERGVAFDDSAPLAGIRHAITRRPAG